MTKQNQFTKEQALTFYNSGIWKSWTDEQLAIFQLYEDKLYIPFDVFHEAIEKVLGRPIWTHEFARPDLLKLELEGIRKQPTLEEIMNLIPKDKRVFFLVKKEGDP